MADIYAGEVYYPGRAYISYEDGWTRTGETAGPCRRGALAPDEQDLTWRTSRRGEAMSELDAAARAAGYEVEARVVLTHGADALLELPGEDVPVRVPASEVAEGAGRAVGELPGMRIRLTVRESPVSGRVLSGFRQVE